MLFYAEQAARKKIETNGSIYIGGRWMKYEPEQLRTPWCADVRRIVHSLASTVAAVSLSLLFSGPGSRTSSSGKVGQLPGVMDSMVNM